MFATGGRITLFAESEAFQATRHRHPVWKVVLPIDGHVLLQPDDGCTVAAPGLVVPPQLTHTCSVNSSYTALFVEPWLLPAGTGPLRLTAGTVRRLLAALGPTGVNGPAPLPDLEAAYGELLTHTGRPPGLDPRVVHAIEAVEHPDHEGHLDTVAAEVGLSPSRLRALVRDSVGTPLTLLRQWGRLRNAVTSLPGASVSTAAAEAGFADQAHLTRTSRKLLGRAPGSLRACPSSGV